MFATMGVSGWLALGACLLLLVSGVVGLCCLLATERQAEEEEVEGSDKFFSNVPPEEG